MLLSTTAKFNDKIDVETTYTKCFREKTFRPITYPFFNPKEVPKDEK